MLYPEGVKETSSFGRCGPTDRPKGGRGEGGGGGEGGGVVVGSLSAGGK